MKRLTHIACISALVLAVALASSSTTARSKINPDAKVKVCDGTGLMRMYSESCHLPPGRRRRYNTKLMTAHNRWPFAASLLPDFLRDKRGLGLVDRIMADMSMRCCADGCRVRDFMVFGC